MSGTSDNVATETNALIAGLRGFLFPAGEEPARLIRAIRMTEVGQIRMPPAAHWIPFAAVQKFDSTRSSFCWEARVDPGKITSVTVTDAYEHAHGRLVVRLGGLVPVKKITGVDTDKAELQRYLASILLCPPILLNHPSRECTECAPRTLPISDRQEPTGAVIEAEVSDRGCPLACRATRPRLVGKVAVPTPWFATGWDFRELQGPRVPRHLKAGWQLPEGAFSYYLGEIVSYQALT